MKKVWLTVVFLVLSLNMAIAMLNEPDNFRGLKWGSSFPKTSDFEKHMFSIVTDDGKEIVLYKKKSENTKIGEIKLGQLLYGFYQDKFCFVRFYPENEFDEPKLKQVFEKLYGPIDSNNGKHQFWYGEKLRVKYYGGFDYEYKPIVDNMSNLSKDL